MGGESPAPVPHTGTNPKSPTATDDSGKESSLFVERRQASSDSGSFLNARSTPASVSLFSPTAHNGNGVSNRAARSLIDSRVNNVALFTAAAHGQVGVVKMLLGMGMDINGQTGGSTPLHVACAKGHDLVVQELMEHGACAFSTDAEGRTPLAVAGQTGHHACEAVIHAHFDSIEPPHREEVSALSVETTPTIGNDKGSLSPGQAAFPVRAEITAASRSVEPVLTLRRTSEIGSASERQGNSRTEQGTTKQSLRSSVGVAHTAESPQTPESAVSGQLRSLPLSHLYTEKQRGEKTPIAKPRVAKSLDLFREFGVTPPKATVRCISCKPLRIVSLTSCLALLTAAKKCPKRSSDEQ
jgi:hypothetical protein